MDVLAPNGSVTYSAVLPPGFEFARDLPNVPAWSPDGRSIAVSGCVCRGAVNESQIWIADTQSKEVRAITNAKAAFDYQPVWTADGTVLFARNTGAVWEIHADGTGARLIAPTREGYLREILPAPDARHLALTATRGDEVEIVDAQQGHEIARVTLDHAAVAVRWSLDGQHLWIAEAGNGPNGEGILVEVDLSGHQTRTVAYEVADFDVVYAR